MLTQIVPKALAVMTTVSVGSPGRGNVRVVNLGASTAADVPLVWRRIAALVVNVVQAAVLVLVVCVMTAQAIATVMQTICAEATQTMTICRWSVFQNRIVMMMTQ